MNIQLDFILFNNNMLTLDIIRVLSLLPILLYASYTDFKTRRVNNKVWIPAIIIGFILLAYEYYMLDNPIEIILIFILSLIPIAIITHILFESRVFYGADVKAMMVIALLIPKQPEFYNLPIFDISVINIDYIIQTGFEMENITYITAYILTDVFAFTVLINSFLFGFVYIIWNGIYNIKNKSFNIKKPILSLSSRQVKVEELPKYYGPIIKENESNNWLYKRLLFIQNSLNGLSSEFFKDYTKWHKSATGENFEFNEITKIKFEKFVEQSENWKIEDLDKDLTIINNILKKEKVWITPGVPFIIPITLGFIASVTFGNILYILI